MRKMIFAATVLMLPAIVSAQNLISESPPGAEVYFVQPADGDTLSGDVTVVFGLKNMGVAPAGSDIANTGHHHLLIDMEELPDMTMPLPSSDNVRHFGGGQTETVITLEPGTHTLQLVLGNFAHVPHNSPVMSEKITITVE